MSGSGWYLLIHQLPQKPLYFRARIRELLDKAGALALKNSVYVLPARDHLRARFEAIAQDVTAGGGEAFVCAADFLDEGADERLTAAFRKQRDESYDELAARVGAWTRPRPGRTLELRDGRLRLGLAQARKRLETFVALDYFGAPGRKRAEAALAESEARLREREHTADPRQPWLGRTWVTRRGVQVDRIASAWFIRRFLDPSARFRFVASADEPRRPGEVRFDMAGGDFTHEEDRCTLEALVKRTGVRDAALNRVAQIVHDIDLKDGKFGRPEAPGLEQVLRGLTAAHGEDEARLARGFALFDDLYASFCRQLGKDPKG